MKLYIHTFHYNILGITFNMYRLCSHPTECNENVIYLDFSKQNSPYWFVFVRDKEIYKDGSLSTIIANAKFEHFNNMMDYVLNEVGEQIEIKTQKKIDIKDIEIVGLNKIIE